MKEIFNKVKLWLKRFFFPPAGSPTWLRVLPYAILGVLTLFVLTGATYTWEYTNSTEFCGTACHETHPLEYYAYLQSPHARVRCVECHIGRSAFATQFTRKAGDLRHVILNITGDYEYPIYSHAMRPAQDSCETCHFPEKFSSDSLREIVHYRPDEDNSINKIFLLMHTGGGVDRDDLGLGIHWHIQTDVQYYATDEHEQDIPYVRVLEDDGTYTEYFDVASDFDFDSINEDELQTVDCITCHNRITHDVPKPDQAISKAVENGLISLDLPYVVREATRLLDFEYATKDEGLANMDSLAAYYEVNYPKIYAQNQAEVWMAVDAIRQIYDQNVFPDQLFDWDTHADNLGHKDDPGCFRCHDAGHMTVDQELIRLECNLCHSVPLVVDPKSSTTEIEVLSGPEPQSHTYTTWMALHGKAVNFTCEACHPTEDPNVHLVDLVQEGKPPTDSSFCGNEACHSNVWTFTSFGEEALQPMFEAQLAELAPPPLPEPVAGDEPVPLTYVDAIAPILDNRCVFCHVDEDSGGLDLTSFENMTVGGDNGPVFVSGDAEASLIVQVQSSSEGHYAELTSDQLNTVIEWINAGAPEK